jgi:hypothetical protein
MRLLLVFWIGSLLLSFPSRAQLNENFNDGNFTSNPTWVGNTSDFIVNAAMQLQSNNTVANSFYYLSTSNTLATSAQWDFYVQLAFNTSSANFVDVYLTASGSDITQPATTGYFVRIGNTDDEISLYRKEATGNVVEIIDGVNGVLNTSNNVMKIRVTRSNTNVFTLSRDLSGTGTSYVTEGTVTDATYTTSSFFGILVRQSTASFFQRHYFDDIEIKPFVPDVTPPAIVSATATSVNTLDVLFNEPVDLATSQNTANYSANNGIGNPTAAVRDATNTSLVRLTFANNFPNGVNATLTVNSVRDLAGNAISNGTATFSFYTPRQYDIVIDEIMADPTPQVGLPNNEWIELRNTSTFTINLQGWRIADAGGQSGALPSYTLRPDSFVILTTTSAVAAMSAFGPTIGVTSFPSLDNDGEVLSLLSPQGKVVHAVNYSSSWYQNIVKREGGWSLEMIDPKNPCQGISNWKASVDPAGGTPGRKNSIDAANADQDPPRLVRASSVDNLNVILYFNEPLDSTRAGVAANYSISDGIGTPQSASAIGPVFDRVALRLTTPIVANKTYTVTVSNLTDCVGNTVGAFRTARLGLSSTADSFDVVINEILFNPKPNQVDYVELYNRSNKIIDLKQLMIANRSSTGAISSIRALTTESVAFFPGDFIVLTEDPDAIRNSFVAKNPDAFLQVASMPSFPDDDGVVVILNSLGAVVDELRYDEDWHFGLIDNDEGVALERIDYNSPTKRDNFHSAATSAGYGTPGYQNSQFRMDQQVQGEITVTPETFSPDNDGFDDILTIDYNFPERGYVATITIFDAAGRPVRYLQRKALSAQKGSYRWDGLGEKGQKLNVGIYIVVTEIFNLQGKRKQFRNAVVLARRLN